MDVVSVDMQLCLDACVSLFRCLKKRGHKCDIIRHSEYIKNQAAFKEACTELTNLGYGYRTSYKEIIASGQTF